MSINLKPKKKDQAYYQTLAFEYMPPALLLVLKNDDIIHIGNCLESLEKKLTTPDYEAGSFVTWLSQRKIYEALQHADIINQVAIIIYCKFLYNNYPI